MSVIYRNGQKYAGMNLGAYQKKESEYVTQSGTTTTVPIGIDGYRSTDILLVDVNGLNLVEDTDYTISGTNIVLDTPITKAGESIHFVSLRTGSVESVDLSSLKGDKGDKGDAGVVDAYPRTGATPLSANWLSETSGGSALTPESDQIYILMADSGDYTANSMFRWNGSAYEPLTSGGSGGGGHVELTQAEYDELTQEEKENGEVYFITDGVPEYTVINDSVPIGAIQSYGGVSLPYGWLFCDGAAVSRETYSELFTAIGTTYGPGDGSTTFNLPDLRGRVLIGESSSYTIGSSGGAATHTLTVAEMPSHRHWLSQDYDSGNWESVSGGFLHLHTPAASSGTGWLTDSYTTGMKAAGGSQAHNNMQPYLVGNYIIKALNTVSSSRLEELDPQQILFNMFYPVGSYYETSDATFDPNVQWRGTWVLETAGQVHVSAGTGYAVGATGGEATHTLTVNEMPSHNHGYYYTSDTATKQYPWRTGGGSEMGYDIVSRGGDQPHNNMQPYIVVNRWHRTA